MATPYTVGDTAPALTGTVNADLTSASLIVHIARPDGTVISRAGTIVSAVAGTWSFQLVAGDLTLPGVYRVEVEVTFSGSNIQTFAFDASGQSVTFSVRDQIG